MESNMTWEKLIELTTGHELGDMLDEAIIRRIAFVNNGRIFRQERSLWHRELIGVRLTLHDGQDVMAMQYDDGDTLVMGWEDYVQETKELDLRFRFEEESEWPINIVFVKYHLDWGGDIFEGLIPAKSEDEAALVLSNQCYGPVPGKGYPKNSPPKNEKGQYYILDEWLLTTKVTHIVFMGGKEVDIP